MKRVPLIVDIHMTSSQSKPICLKDLMLKLGDAGEDLKIFLHHQIYSVCSQIYLIWNCILRLLVLYTSLTSSVKTFTRTTQEKEGQLKC